MGHTLDAITFESSVRRRESVDLVVAPKPSTAVYHSSPAMGRVDQPPFCLESTGYVDEEGGVVYTEYIHDGKYYWHAKSKKTNETTWWRLRWI